MLFISVIIFRSSVYVIKCCVRHVSPTHSIANRTLDEDKGETKITLPRLHNRFSVLFFVSFCLCTFLGGIFIILADITQTRLLT